MGLTTVFFDYDGDPGYAKAIVDDRCVEFFVKMGASLKMAPAEPVEVDISSKSIPSLSGVSGDKGAGKPGSLEWHKTHLKQANSKISIGMYVKDVTGQLLPTSGEREDVMEKAVKAIEKYLKGE